MQFRLLLGKFSSSTLALFVTVIAVFLLSPNPAFAQNIVVFDVPGAANTRAMRINETAEIAGSYYDVNQSAHGFYRSSTGVITAFDVPGANQGFLLGTTPASINDAATIAGFYTATNGHAATNYHGFTRDRAGNIVTFDAPDASTRSNEGTFVSAINQSGQVAGYYNRASLSTLGYIRDAAGNFTTFDAAGTNYTQVFAVNTLGSVAGIYRDRNFASHGFFRNGASGAITTFDVPFVGGSETVAVGLNDAGVVVGSYQTSDGDCGFVLHGFIRFPGGIFANVDFANSLFGTEVTGVNNAGTVVGFYSDKSNVNISFVRDPKGNVTTFSAPGAGTSYGSGTLALGINRRGNIAGISVDQRNVDHGFVRK